MKQKFYKYHGAGNDFVLIDNRSGGFDVSRAHVAALCCRRTGVGADGLMLLENDPRELFRMRYFNADGGESTMCGNGGRCIVLFAHHLGIGGSRKRFSGIDGVHDAQILSADATAGEIRLGMIDVPRVEKFPDHYFLDTGSPHHVAAIRTPPPEGRTSISWRSFRTVVSGCVLMSGALRPRRLPAEPGPRLRRWRLPCDPEAIAGITGSTSRAESFSCLSNGQETSVLRM